ncbi:MAG TPA: hypothetical protein VLF63_01670 [Patescibacteria group bacterium]|nr:hypothetical protein [Patescibacteria group bacterium]
MDQVKDIYLPKWASILYAGLALVLLPWIFIIAEYLPTKQLAKHWDSLWVGFDIIILISILLTLYFIMMKKVWVIISASALGTLFIVDAWFDILTSKPGHEQMQSYFFGVIEVSLAILTYRMVYLIIHQSGHHKSVKLRTRIRKQNI